MKKILAIFKDVEYGFINAHDNRFEKVENYVRMTEYVEIDFPDREQSEVINSQIAALDAAAEELGKKYMEGLESIKLKKAELLALTEQS